MARGNGGRRNSRERSQRTQRVLGLMRLWKYENETNEIKPIETTTMKIELRTITPEMAQKMLLLNFGNRGLSEKGVAKLVKVIKLGRWQVNGDVIRFSPEGRLLDGQHRLTAIVRSGIAIETYVAEGVPCEAFESIDQNKIRTFADTLAAMGVKDHNRVGAALKMVDKYTTGNTQKSVDYSNDQVAPLLEKYPKIIEAMEYPDHNSLLPPRVMDACNYLFKQKDEKLAASFMTKVLRGLGIEEGSPEYVLRERLIRNAASTAKLPIVLIFALCIKAWNHARDGRKITKLALIETNGRLNEFPIIK